MVFVASIAIIFALVSHIDRFEKAFKPTWKAQHKCYVYIEITRPTNEYKVKLNKFSV